MIKTVSGAHEAIEKIQDGASIMIGGFGLCGTPENLIRALHEKGTRDLTIISNNGGIDGLGIGLLIRRGESAF